MQLTTGTAADARRTATWADGHGIDYLDGAIWEYPAGIGAAETALVYSGPAGLFTRHEPVLRALGGATVHVGEPIGAAAVYDTAMLIAYYGASVSFLAGVALCDAEGISPADFLATFAPLGPVIAATQDLATRQVVTGHYPGDDCRMDLHATAAKNVVRAVEESSTDPRLATVVSSLMERTIELGHSDSSLASIFTALRSPGPALSHA